MTNKSYFYQDKPVFGLDIGFSSLKVMQMDSTGKRPVVTAYGYEPFAPEALADGIIVKPEIVAKAAHDLFSKRLVGHITTKRVAIALPASHTFTHSMTLPALKPKELEDAVRLEAERYIPVPLDDLYIDYAVIRATSSVTELLAVAVPRAIVDSYMDLTRILGLEPVVIETTLTASSRLFVAAEQSDVPSVLIDLGSLSTDISIYDDALIVTGTVPGGGDSFTNNIAKSLGITKQEAHIVKTKYGLGVSKKQKEILAATKPTLEQMVKEIRRMIRYYEERTGVDRKINQVITMGGGANMPGLSEYMTNALRLPVRMTDPWHNLSFGKLQPPNTVEKSMYITVAGLALVEPREMFR